jgi:membrane-bound inhibitor of C-type lysozyme
MSTEKKVYTTRSRDQRSTLKLMSFTDGTTQIDSFPELELYLNDSPQLLEAIAIPVLNENAIDWYSKHHNLKLLNEFERGEQMRIKQRVDDLLKAGIESSNSQPKRIEFLASLVTKSFILSNGQNDVLIWGYEQQEQLHLNMEGITVLEGLKEETERRRERYGGASGKLTISLIWDTDDDLDLHVVEPDGEEIHYSKTISKSGGKLDIDANASDETILDNPVENIFWQDPPKGKYRVIVSCYSRRSTLEGGIPFEVLVLDEVHDNTRSHKGSITSTSILEELPIQIHI